MHTLVERAAAGLEALGWGLWADGDFDHPRLPRGHPLCRHVLYRLTHSAWRGHAGGSCA